VRFVMTDKNILAGLVPTMIFLAKLLTARAKIVHPLLQ